MVFVFKAAVHGIAAYAGNNPRQGAEAAIWEMAKKIDDIQNMTDWDKGITFNVGTIKGGTVSNAKQAVLKRIFISCMIEPALDTHGADGRNAGIHNVARITAAAYKLSF